MIHFNPRETRKLTMAPMAARMMVFMISSDWMLARTVSNVPPNVPAAVPW